MRRFLSVALLLTCLAVASAGCEGDYRPRAVGLEGQVNVVMDSASWQGSVGEAVRANVAPNVNTLPAPERYFQLQQRGLSERSYNRIQELKNVIFVAPLSETSNEADFIRQRLSEDAREAVESGQTAVVARDDLWRRSQKVFYVTAADTAQLIDALQNEGERIRREFKKITLDRMEREMFSEERQYAMEDSLLKTHGFRVKVQHDYQFAAQDTTGDRKTVWLARVPVDTRRDLIIHYVENASPSLITEEWVYNTRDSLTRKYIRGNVAGFMRIDYRRPLDTAQSGFLDRFGYQSRGLWHMVASPDSVGMDGDYGDDEFVQMGAGGPFINYTFYDQPSGRVFMIDGSVFAPTYDKLEFLRQMEVIARTFKTKREVDAESAEQPAAVITTGN